MKRGLLDVGGSILHALFGVATSAQLERFHAAVKEVAGSQMAVSHAMAQLSTIINQTRSNVIKLAAHQHQISVHMAQINAAIRTISTSMHETTRRLHRVELITDLDRYLDTLDIAAAEYASQLTLFHRQRSDLELGQLTRDLLTQSQLEEILQQAASQHKVMSSIEWYYQYLTVTPIWHAAASLVYKVELPLIAPRPYLMYHILTHPVPVGNASTSIIVKLQEYYALDTISGNLFIPSNCVGHDPTICQNGPEYGPSLQQCARGLITNRPSLINMCSVSVDHLTSLPSITKIDLNQYALATTGETLIIRCPGSTETHHKLARGTYNITCARPCSISGLGWSITCIDRLYLSRRYVMPAVRVTAHFNFTTSVKLDQLHNVLPQLKTINAPNMVDMDVVSLFATSSPITHVKLNHTPSIIAVINSSIIITVWIIISIAYLRWRRLQARSRRPVIHPTEALPLAPPSALHNHAQPATDHSLSARIWPVLPPIGDCLSLKASAPSNTEHPL